ncbi:MAG TPA: hypothetical protein VK211_14620 [Kamptonema sp.]|nr:hypothetical protein [Kamptonema sp.]
MGEITKRRKINANSPATESAIDRVEKLKKLSSVVTLLERARDEAQETQMEDVEMVVKSALNLVFSTYYFRLRDEYVEKKDAALN